MIINKSTNISNKVLIRETIIFILTLIIHSWKIKNSSMNKLKKTKNTFYRNFMILYKIKISYRIIIILINLKATNIVNIQILI